MKILLFLWLFTNDGRIIDGTFTQHSEFDTIKQCEAYARRLPKFGSATFTDTDGVYKIAANLGRKCQAVTEYSGAGNKKKFDPAFNEDSGIVTDAE